MHVRALTLALAFALTLGACTPPAQQAADDDAAKSTDAPAAAAAATAATANNPDHAALAGPVAPGEWLFSRGWAAFAVDGEQEATLLINCTEGTGRVDIHYAIELPDGERTSIRVITASQTFDVPMISSNEGMGYIVATLPNRDPRLDALAATQERFGITFDGFTGKLPWERGIGQALRECGV